MMSPTCPRHHVTLDGGPILFQCPQGHSVYAADLDNEYRPTSPAPCRVPPLAQAAFAWALTTSLLTLVFTVVAR